MFVNGLTIYLFDLKRISNSNLGFVERVMCMCKENVILILLNFFLDTLKVWHVLMFVAPDQHGTFSVPLLLEYLNSQESQYYVKLKINIFKHKIFGN